jgi:hypothetical protein
VDVDGSVAVGSASRDGTVRVTVVAECGAHRSELAHQLSLIALSAVERALREELKLG